MSTPNMLDRAISFVSPGTGLKRAASRVRMDALGVAQRNYKAAGRGRRFDGWRAPGTSANASLETSLPLLRARARDLVRNNPYAARAIAVIQSNVVGPGILPEVPEDNQAAMAAQELWREWANSTDCDADGRTDFKGLQSLFMRSIAEGGEVLVRARWRKESDGLPVPLQLQILEADHLDDSMDGPAGGKNHYFQGIEFDALGRRTNYWLLKQHPGDSRGSLALNSTRVPAKHIIHGFRRDRPGQQRGVPWAAPAIMRLLELDRFEDAQLLRQEIAACFAAFVTDVSGGDNGGVVPDADQFPNSIEPGMIQRLGPGESVTLSSPPGVQAYAEFTRQVLLAIAAAFGVSYEALTGDLAGVNFSSGRMGFLEFQRNITTWQRQIVIGQLCQPVWGWFMEAARMSGKLQEPVKATWTPPRRQMVDPTKEVPAMKDAVRAGFLPLSEALRELGRDPDEALQAMARDNAKLDALGLVLDSDPRQDTPSTTGSVAKESEEETPEADKDSD